MQLLVCWLSIASLIQDIRISNLERKIEKLKENKWKRYIGKWNLHLIVTISFVTF